MSGHKRIKYEIDDEELCHADTGVEFIQRDDGSIVAKCNYLHSRAPELLRSLKSVLAFADPHAALASGVSAASDDFDLAKRLVEEIESNEVGEVE